MPGTKNQNALQAGTRLAFRGQFHLMMRCAAPLFMFALVFEGV